LKTGLIWSNSRDKGTNYVGPLPTEIIRLSAWLFIVYFHAWRKRQVYVGYASFPGCFDIRWFWCSTFETRTKNWRISYSCISGIFSPILVWFWFVCDFLVFKLGVCTEQTDGQTNRQADSETRNAP